MTQINPQTTNILLAEDDPVNQMVAKINLEQLGYTQVDVANDGKEAVDMVAKKMYDIVFMDVNMPFVNGCVATQQIRQHEQQTNTHVPIIAMTADTLTNDLQTCSEAGMDDVLEKPIAKAKLKQILDKLLIVNP